MSTQTHQVRDTIKPTTFEENIFKRLLATLSHFQLQTQIHVAGGWVRDKLLGKVSHDIDIALDNMMGTQFVDKFKEYLLSIGEDVQGFCVVKSKPEHSKHLETDKISLFAEEDAYRRDLTINSLFYNIVTGAVEDWTKRGARFDFTLDDDLKVAAASDDVKKALAKKIKRERIGTEIDLIISRNQPVKAITYICELTLFWTVFTLPPEHESVIFDGCERLCISYLYNASNLIHLLGESTFTAEQRRLALYAALFLPLRNTTYSEEKIPVVSHIIRESLKRKAKDAEKVLDLHRWSYKFLPLIPYLASGEVIQASDLDWMRDLIDVPDSSRARVITGFLLRELRDFWRVALLISILLHPIDSCDSEDEHSHFGIRKDLFNAVENSITKLGLEDVKPLINGKDVMNVFQLKGGPLVKEWVDKTMAWQLANPSRTAKECINWLREANSKRVKLE